jgi:hypothetical protein
VLYRDITLTDRRSLSRRFLQRLRLLFADVRVNVRFDCRQDSIDISGRPYEWLESGPQFEVIFHHATALPRRLASLRAPMIRLQARQCRSRGLPGGV